MRGLVLAWSQCLHLSGHIALATAAFVEGTKGSKVPNASTHCTGHSTCANLCGSWTCSRACRFGATGSTTTTARDMG